MDSILNCQRIIKFKYTKTINNLDLQFDKATVFLNIIQFYFPKNNSNNFILKEESIKAIPPNLWNKVNFFSFLSSIIIFFIHFV